MYALFQRFYEFLSRIRLFWLAIFCLGLILLWSQISLPDRSFAKLQTVQSPREILAKSVTELRVRCSEVPYGNLSDRNQRHPQLLRLPLNELLIELVG